MVSVLIGYVYMIKNYTLKKHYVLSKKLKKRVAKAKSIMYNNLIDLMIITLNTNKRTNYE